MGSLGCTVALTVTSLLGVGLTPQEARASRQEPSSLAWRAYVRDLSRAGETPYASSCDISGPTSRDRLAELSAMLGGESVPLSDVELESVAWSDAADLRRRVTAAKRRVECSYSALVERLRVKGWLTATEAGGLHPDIRIEMHDLRVDQSQRLPVP